MLCTFPGVCAAEQQHFTVDVKTITPAHQGDYFITLLKLVLEASKAENETIDYQFTDHPFSQQRWMVELSRETGNSIMWTMTSKEREKILTPIREPLFQGLIGQRVLVIRRADQERFARIKTLDQLKSLVAGQGSQWPDNDILRANGLQVTEAADTVQLYKMLAAKRFDYFPRGVMEISAEQAFLTKYDLIVEPHLVISYPAAIYFFVNNHNPDLAQRLYKGWARIHEDGTFDSFFLSQPRVQQALTLLVNKSLTPIYLYNPDAPDTLKVKPLSFWLDSSTSSTPVPEKTNR